MNLGVLLLTENSLFKAIGDIFHPIFLVVAYVLAVIYGVVPNYAVSIALLTVLVMAILTPLTVKSTKSMLAMQRMQPEIKKLQQKYKGAENREKLNQELMRVYKEQGINPASGCVPMLLQSPFLFILYDTIKGLTHTTTQVVNTAVPSAKTWTAIPFRFTSHVETVANPLYIPHGSKMRADLVAHPGSMKSFGMNLALKPFSHHSSVAAAIPFFVFVVLAVGLQYFQMKQMSGRNPQAAQANPQMQTMQKVMPLFFAYIYFIVPAAVVIYMIVSTFIRILTQDILFRSGIVQPVGERAIPASSTPIDPKPKPAGVLAALLGGRTTATPANGTANGSTSVGTKPSGSGSGGPGGSGGVKKVASGAPGSAGANPKRAAAAGSGGAKTGSAKPGGTKAVGATKGQVKRSTSAATVNGSAPVAGGSTTGTTDEDGAKRPHPRAKGKRERKAR